MWIICKETKSQKDLVLKALKIWELKAQKYSDIVCKNFEKHLSCLQNDLYLINFKHL